MRHGAIMPCTAVHLGCMAALVENLAWPRAAGATEPVASLQPLGINAESVRAVSNALDGVIRES